MEGDEAKRFCAGCGCFVHNVEQMDAAQAEALLSNQERVCTRLTINAKREILTRDGWIPRLILAGAVAATVAGCQTTTGEASVPNEKPKASESKKPPKNEETNFMGFISDRPVVTSKKTESEKDPHSQKRTDDNDQKPAREDSTTVMGSL